MDRKGTLRYVLERIAKHPIDRIEDASPMERRPRHSGDLKPGRVAATPPANIEWTPGEYGNITISEISPAGTIAAAADNDLLNAMLRRRRGATVLNLLHRLDQAIAKPTETHTPIDEVNPAGGFPSTRP